jgi:ribulose-5-phosphate 4-epimerase/fuculose-1-phosphate aldolase
MHNFEEFNSVGKDLYMLGLVGSGTGSLSVRSGDKIYITKRNAMLGHLQEGDIIEVPLEGAGQGEELAAKEIQVHRAIYKETNFNAVIQAFPPYGIALSINTENKIIPADIKGQTVLRSIPVVRAKSSPEELVKYLPPVYKSGYIVSLVKEYGSFAVGASLFETLQYTTCLEDSCKIIAINRSLTTVEKQKRPEHHERRTAIPLGIGVMGRPRGSRRGFGR